MYGTNVQITNAVERRNQDCKDGSPLPIRQCLVSMYKLDKAFCAKFLAAKDGSNLSKNGKLSIRFR